VYPVFDIDLEGVGRYVSVNLVADVSKLQSPDAARGVARPLGALFREAVQKARERTTVDDPGRRSLFEGLRGD
jgi:hypothetical protein